MEKIGKLFFSSSKSVRFLRRLNQQLEIFISNEQTSFEEETYLSSRLWVEIYFYRL